MKVPLVLGTAEFNPEGYNGVKVEEEEAVRIFSLAREAGIHLLDTAESYNCHDLIKYCAKGFSVYTKTRNWRVNLAWGDNELRGILYHYGFLEERRELPFIHRWVNLGASVYLPAQLPDERMRIIQVPFNIDDCRFINVFETYRTVFVRSVFNRGKLLEKYSVKECLDFVQKYRPDGVIVGVKNVKELEEILKAAS